MKNLCWFVAFLFMSVNVLAQKKDTVKSHPIQIGGLDDPSIKIETKPLVLLDGKVYTGSVNQIEPGSIAEVNVVRDTTYIKRFGKQAINGIVIITTKGHQNIYAGKNSYLADHAALPDDAMYVIDGVMSDKKLDGIDPKEILSINVLKKNSTTESTGIDPAHDMVIVVTKAGAIKSYQKKLSDFSTAYKKYLESHNGDDSGLTYVVEGGTYNTGTEDHEKLYKLPKEKIAKVSLSVKNNITNVIITTKK